MDSILGDSEGIEVRAAHADEGFYGAVMLHSVQFSELFVVHDLMVFWQIR